MTAKTNANTIRDDEQRLRRHLFWDYLAPASPIIQIAIMGSLSCVSGVPSHVFADMYPRSQRNASGEAGKVESPGRRLSRSTPTGNMLVRCPPLSGNKQTLDGSQSYCPGPGPSSPPAVSHCWHQGANNLTTSLRRMHPAQAPPLRLLVCVVFCAPETACCGPTSARQRPPSLGWQLEARVFRLGGVWFDSRPAHPASAED